MGWSMKKNPYIKCAYALTAAVKRRLWLKRVWKVVVWEVAELEIKRCWSSVILKRGRGFRRKSRIIIALLFANLSHNLWVQKSFPLIELYNQIHHKFPFEVVLVPFTHPDDLRQHPRVDPHRSFTSIFSSMPWTAIPYSDVTSWKRLLTTFGYAGRVYPDTPVIHPTGLVLDLYAYSKFRSFGASAYPFTRQRINLLLSQTEVIHKYPSIWNLLASPDRDYVISNNGILLNMLWICHYPLDLDGTICSGIQILSPGEEMNPRQLLFTFNASLRHLLYCLEVCCLVIFSNLDKVQFS